MPSIHDTAYPRLKAVVTVRDLAEVYTPTPEEQTLATTLTLSVPSQIGFLVVLKTFQRLGYFVPVQAVPQSIVEHIATHVGTVISPQEIHAYDASRDTAASYGGDPEPSGPPGANNKFFTVRRNSGRISSCLPYRTAFKNKRIRETSPERVGIRWDIS
jgi:hypothetical protein